MILFVFQLKSSYKVKLQKKSLKNKNVSRHLKNLIIYSQEVDIPA